MDDGEDDMGSTTTSETELELTPEQLSAQRLGLNVLDTTLPNQAMQIRRALALLQPQSDVVAQGPREAIAGPIGTASSLVRRALGTSLTERGLPGSVTAPVVENVRRVDDETLNASRNQFIDRLMAGSPIQLFRPDIGRYLVDPNKATQTSTSKQGTGGQATQYAGLAVGIASVVIAAI